MLMLRLRLRLRLGLRPMLISVSICLNKPKHSSCFVEETAEHRWPVKKL